MHIKVKRDFFDKKKNMLLRKEGEIMEVDADRGRQLIALRLAGETDKPNKKAAAN